MQISLFFTNISKFSINSRFFSQTDHDPVDADLHAVAVSEGGHIDGREEVDDSRAARGEGDQLEGHVMMGDHRDQDLSQAAADESFTSIHFFIFRNKTNNILKMWKNMFQLYIIIETYFFRQSF